MSDKAETKTRNEAAAADSGWFVRMSNGSIFGPINTKGLTRWAVDGRIMPDDEISTDRVKWRAARDLPELGMNVMIELPDGTFMGPYNASAIEPLVREGKIPTKAKRFDIGELEERLANRQMELFGDETWGGEDGAADQEAPEQEMRTGRRTSGKAAAEQRLRAEFEEMFADLKRERDDAVAEAERIQGDLRAELDAALGKLAKAESGMETAQKKLAKAEAELEAAAGAETVGKAEYDGLAAEIEKLKGELGEAERELDAIAQADLQCQMDGLVAENSDLKAQLDKVGAALAEERSRGVPAREEMDALINENAGLRKELMDAEQAMDSIAKAESDEREMAGLVQENTALQAKLVDADARLEELQAEHHELLTFSNDRDVEAREKIRELMGRCAEIEAKSADAAQQSAEGDGSADPAADVLGPQRRIKDLGDRLAELSRERDLLRDSLAEANARAASAVRPVEGDIATIKMFADGALGLMRQMLEDEKERNTVARAASADMQNVLHNEISRLERVLDRDPGEISRTEQATLRTERQIAQLQQELESARRHHQADMARAEANEKAVEGRCKALVQKEALLREKLSRVEQRTADYDSLTSQLRRKESALLAAEKEFEEARQQWQIIETTLQNRIEELEKGSGLLFDQASAQQQGAAASDDRANQNGNGNGNGSPMRSVEPNRAFRSGPRIRLMK